MANISQTRQNTDTLFSAAVELQNYGNIVAAEMLYIQILTEYPNHFASLNKMAELAIAAKNYDDALVYASKALQVNPKSDVPAGIMGLVFLHKNDLYKAIICFNKAISIEPGNVEYYNNIATALFMQKKYAEVLEYSQIALERFPKDCYAANNIATAYVELGELEKALPLYQLALENNPAMLDSVYNILQVLSMLGRYDELLTFTQDIKNKNIFSPVQMAGLNITEAIIYLQRNRFDLCGYVLNEIKGMPEGANSFPNYTNYKIYYNYLRQLLTFHKNNQPLYIGECESNLYIIGDSHCLSPAFTCVTIGGAKYKCIPKLIKGIQARHFTDNIEDKKYMKNFSILLEGIPDNSTIVLMVGEIDTRSKHGILSYHKKTGKVNKDAINFTIKTIVRRYVAFCVSKAKPKNLNIIFYGVPADNIDESLVPVEDIRWLRYIIRNFNDEMRGVVQDAGAQFIDIYKMTVSGGGKALGGWHIDDIHLLPGVFGVAYGSKP